MRMRCDAVVVVGLIVEECLGVLEGDQRVGRFGQSMALRAGGDVSDAQEVETRFGTCVVALTVIENA